VSLILEGIVTSQNTDGSTNVAPMGPTVDRLEQGELRALIFRPFPDSTTCRNLLRHPEGVFHVTDDVLLFARAVTRHLAHNVPELQAAEVIRGQRLQNCCRWHEFRILEVDFSQPRVVMKAEVVRSGTAREWLGLNRAQHACVEAAILATRLHLLDRNDVECQLAAFRPLVEKTAGAQEKRAWDMLEQYIAEYDTAEPEVNFQKLADQAEES